MLTVLDRHLLQVLVAVGREVTFVSSWAAARRFLPRSGSPSGSKATPGGRSEPGLAHEVLELRDFSRRYYNIAPHGRNEA